MEQSQLVRKFTAFMKPESSLLCSQEPATSPHPDPGESNPHPSTLFPSDQF
jgi:hypothetical protein